MRPPKYENPHPKNREIRGNTIRIVTESASQEVPKLAALKKAEEVGLDLIQISKSPQGMPICKIGDYGKFKYLQEKKKPKVKLHKEKEIGIRPATDPHDLTIKLDHATGFLKQGHPVLFRLKFKGREKAHRELGQTLLEKIREQLQDQTKADPIQANPNGMIMRLHPKTP